MKLLSIGNSFSTDAQRWLHSIAESAGQDLYTVNLYIGGCTLEKHWRLFGTGEPEYHYQINGNDGEMVSLKEGISREKWDIITLQQQSGRSGLYKTFQPYLSDLHREVSLLCPDAKFYLHKTWAYETDFDNTEFDRYGRQQDVMYRQIGEAFREATKPIGAPVIPVGEVIQYLRQNCPEFDYQHGGMSLNRDGFHLSYHYGRYAAGLTFYGVLFGEVDKPDFIPEVPELTTDPALIEKIRDAVRAILKQHNYIR